MPISPLSILGLLQAADGGAAITLHHGKARVSRLGVGRAPGGGLLSSFESPPILADQRGESPSPR